ncbi:MAG: methyltransferase domain-containing protein [Rhodospirillales bacterium]|nr:methyltransferase domain-containing protein [Rhodospirillales bacterium]
MRKDFVEIDSTQSESEIAFVERYWTAVWEREGGPKAAINKIPGKAEYRIMQPYIESLSPGARLLDGGCGLGDWSAYLTRKGYPTLGLDISRSTVAKLKELFPDVEFAVGDIRETGLPADSFDGYFSWGTFEHFEEGLERCVAEAWRILKPGGYLFISVPFDNFRHALRATFDRRRKVDPRSGKERFYQWRLTRPEVRGLLARGGFSVLDIRPIHKRQGVLRSLHHEFGFPYEWLATKGLGIVLTPFIPGGLVAHMLMAVAKKPLPQPVERGDGI